MSYFFSFQFPSSFFFAKNKHCAYAISTTAVHKGIQWFFYDKPNDNERQSSRHVSARCRRETHLVVCINKHGCTIPITAARKGIQRFFQQQQQQQHCSPQKHTMLYIINNHVRFPCCWRRSCLSLSMWLCWSTIQWDSRPTSCKSCNSTSGSPTKCLSILVTKFSCMSSYRFKAAASIWVYKCWCTRLVLCKLIVSNHFKHCSTVPWRLSPHQKSRDSWSCFKSRLAASGQALHRSVLRSILSDKPASLRISCGPNSWYPCADTARSTMATAAGRKATPPLDPCRSGSQNHTACAQEMILSRRDLVI